MGQPANDHVLAEVAPSGRRRALSDEQTARLWSALWAGEWTVVERTEIDGICRLVVQRRARAAKGLSSRERQLLAYARRGHSQKYIALELGLAPSTVSSGLTSAMRALGIRHRCELSRLARVPQSG